MQFRVPSTLFVALAIAAITSTSSLAEARRPSGGRGPPPSRRGPVPSSRSGGSRRQQSGARSRRASSRRVDDYDEEEDEFDFGDFPGESDGGYDEDVDAAYDFEEEYDQYEDMRRGPPRGSQRGGRSSRGSSRPSGRGGRDPRARGGRSSSSRVVPYGNQRRGAPQPGAFTRGLSALRDSMPDAGTIKNSAFSSIAAAKEATSKVSSNLYREIKGLTSSELEQVMLKATQPNDTPVKGKHVERLVGVTYQISGRYDIYDAVLRKLWSKMVEKDWRTNIKALYILHRFSADGAPDHQAALKARLRELRRTVDPKRKVKYFNSKSLLAGDATPANKAFREFLGRYAHYVLLRAQCFGGIFSEIGVEPSEKRGSSSKSRRPQPKKIITSTCLKSEHLEASQMLLKAGLACALKEDEECENISIALERVAADLIGLTTAVAKALNNALRSDDYDSDEMDRDLVKKWCEFYSEELLPQTKKMVKSTAPILDAYGLFLPSRMGASVSPDLLQKGLQGGDDSAVTERTSEPEEEDVCHDELEDDVEESQPAPVDEEEEKDYGDAEEDLYEAEYEYDEYEYDEY